jgi:hypothetical protein
MQKQFLCSHFAIALFVFQEFDLETIKNSKSGTYSLYFSFNPHTRKSIWTDSKMDSPGFNNLDYGVHYHFKYVLFQLIVSVTKTKYLEKIRIDRS